MNEQMKKIMYELAEKIAHEATTPELRSMYPSRSRGQMKNEFMHFYKSGWIDAMERAKILEEALEFYANQESIKDKKPGDRMEFGCGCCIGIIDKDGTVDPDAEIAGQTAREALSKFRGEE